MSDGEILRQLADGKSVADVVEIVERTCRTDTTTAHMVVTGALFGVEAIDDVIESERQERFQQRVASFLWA